MRKKEMIERIWHIHDRVSILERRLDEKEKLINETLKRVEIAIEELKERGDRK